MLIRGVSKQSRLPVHFRIASATVGDSLHRHEPEEHRPTLALTSAASVREQQLLYASKRVACAARHWSYSEPGPQSAVA